jgi:hypothetical protein
MTNGWRRFDLRSPRAGDCAGRFRSGLNVVDGVITLTDDIRHTAQRLEKLRTRLILMAHAELVQQPGEYFQ